MTEIGHCLQDRFATKSGFAGSKISRATQLSQQYCRRTITVRARRRNGRLALESARAIPVMVRAPHSTGALKADMIFASDNWAAPIPASPPAFRPMPRVSSLPTATASSTAQWPRNSQRDLRARGRGVLRRHRHGGQFAVAAVCQPAGRRRPSATARRMSWRTSAARRNIFIRRLAAARRRRRARPHRPAELERRDRRASCRRSCMPASRWR